MAKSSALRVLFSHRGTDVRLEAALEVDMVVPPSLDTALDRRASAFYFELQDANGRVMYRRGGGHPAPGLLEVSTGIPGQPFTHGDVGVDGLSAEGMFSILVPRSAEGRFVELFATGDGRLDDPASIGRFDLEDAPDFLTPPEAAR